MSLDKCYKVSQWFVLLCLWTTWGYPADILMKNIGSILEYYNYPAQLIDKKKVRYQFPCLDKRQNPNYVMMLRIDSNERRTVCIYQYETLCNLNQAKFAPVISYPEHEKLNTPGALQTKIVPYGFSLGLYCLFSCNKHRKNSDWEIQQMKNKKSLIYKGNIFPYYFDATNDNWGLGYDLKNTIYFNKQGKKITTDKDTILSFHVPDKDYQAINYYSDNHNPDVKISIKTKSWLKNEEGTAEINPKFSQNCKYIAFARNKKEKQDEWELVIYRTNNMDKALETIQDVEIYDLKGSTFYFQDAYHWVDNKIYYINKISNSIYRYDPEIGQKQRIILQDGKHILSVFLKNVSEIDKYGNRKSKIKICKSDEFGAIEIKFNLDIKINKLYWFQAAMRYNDLIIVAECSLKTISKRIKNNKTILKKIGAKVRRIAIFKQEKK